MVKTLAALCDVVGTVQMEDALAHLQRLEAAQGGKVGEVAAAVAEQLGVELEAVKGLVCEGATCFRDRITAMEASLKLQAESQAAMRDMLMTIRSAHAPVPAPVHQHVTHPSCPCY